MLVIPKCELKIMLDNEFGDAASLHGMIKLYEKYGDEYYKDYGEDKWELINENKERIKLIQSYEGN